MTHPSAVEQAETAKRLAANWDRAMLPYIYREMLKNWGWVLLALITPPALVYGIARGLFAVIAWVRRGFSAA